MHRFFLPLDAFTGDPSRGTVTAIRFPNEFANQIRRVLRLRTGERVITLDNLGHEYETEIVMDGGKQVSGIVHRCAVGTRELPYALTLLTPLTRREKFEWILQKCTEAGVTRFIPTVSERSLVQSLDDVEAKRERWERIVREAAEQAQRSRIPVLTRGMTLADALRAEDRETGEKTPVILKLICWEETIEPSLKQVLSGVSGERVKDVRVAVGPEGGYAAEEIAQARDAGWQDVSLGSRIYRAETAALASVILTIYGLEKDS